MFLNCRDIDEAHRLSSLSFGIFNTKHIKGNVIRSSESINKGVYEEKPYIVTIKPRVRSYREKRDRSSIPDNNEKKELMLNQIIKEREYERNIIDNYIVNGEIDFAKLPKIESHTRVTLLRWLTKGISSSNWTSKQKMGVFIRLFYLKKMMNVF